MKKQLSAVVTHAPDEPLTAVVVHYEGWPRCYDELQRVENLRTAHGEEVADVSQLRPGDVVLVHWGSHREQYRAVVRSFFTGKLVCVHYLNSSQDWDQWVKPRQVRRLAE